MEVSEASSAAEVRSVNTRKRKANNEYSSPIEKVVPLMETALSKIGEKQKTSDGSGEGNFGKLIVGILKEIPDGEEKEILTIKIQQDIVATKYRIIRGMNHPIGRNVTSPYYSLPNHSSPLSSIGSPPTPGYGQ